MLRKKDKRRLCLDYENGRAIFYWRDQFGREKRLSKEETRKVKRKLKDA